jgi:uncharacterized damage-inducible protein DinB
MPRPAATLYPDWARANARLVEAVASLGPEQLGLRAGPGHDPVWALAGHVAGARAYWLCGWFEEPGADRTPFTDPRSGTGWEDEPDRPRSGDELAWALESTFGVIADCLARWTLDDLELRVGHEVHGAVREMSRASVLNRLFSHDAFHAGEISQVLGANGLPGIDLWRRGDP